MEILLIIGGIITVITLLATLAQSFSDPGGDLQRRFVAIGTLKGKTRAEIEKAVGPPNSVSATGDEKVLLQWIQAGYHIALLFENDICEGVSHEFAA